MSNNVYVEKNKISSIKNNNIVAILIGFVFFFIFFYRLTLGFIIAGTGKKFSNPANLMNNISSYLSTAINDAVNLPFSTYNKTAVIIGVISGLFFAILFGTKAHYIVSHPYKTVEEGSARFGTKKDAEPFMAFKRVPIKIFGITIPFKKRLPYYYDNRNIILTRTEGISIDRSVIKHPKYYRTANVLVLGTTGSGKTRYMVTPNILQAGYTSYVITDPKGEILRNTGYFLQKQGYNLKVFNLAEPLASPDRYNPFDYIPDGEGEEDHIINVIKTIIKSTTPPKSSQTDPFWEKAETTLLMALFAYVHSYLPKEEQNVGTVIDMLTRMSSDASKNDMGFGGGNGAGAVDNLFLSLPKDTFARKNYDEFALSMGRTRASIMVSAAVRLSPWNIPSIRYLMQEDTMEFQELGKRKTALFIIIPDSTDDFNFIAAMMYTQLFMTLYREADMVYHGKLPVHVRFMLDEFPNIGRIPHFERYLATMRSREISATIIVQDTSQLQGMYSENGEKAWQQIPANVDSILVLGVNNQDTAEWISKKLGKATIFTKDMSVDTGFKNRKHDYQYKKMGRELLKPDEIMHMPNDKCILMIRGTHPFYSDKFILNEHPNYHMLGEANGKSFEVRDILNNIFDTYFEL